MIREYRKRPVVISAVQLTENNVTTVQAWCGSTERTDEGIIIPTLEGDHLAGWGDYVIREVASEFYPCKPDIFHATYGPAA